MALGAPDRAEAETDARALMVDPRVIGDSAAFTVGAIDGARGWVHVFDGDSLSIVLRELSTAADFVHCLNSKVRLLGEGKFGFAKSELDSTLLPSNQLDVNYVIFIGLGEAMLDVVLAADTIEHMQPVASGRA